MFAAGGAETPHRLLLRMILNRNDRNERVVGLRPKPFPLGPSAPAAAPLLLPGTPSSPLTTLLFIFCFS